MSLLKTLGKHPIKSTVLGAVTLAGITYGSLYVALTKSGERVYDGTVNSQKISYHEDASRLTAVTKISENRMEIKRGDATFIFIDSENQNSLNPQVQRRPVGYETDKLETIIVRSPRTSERVFSSNQISDETLYGIHTGKVFARGNQVYNTLRTIVREEIRDNLCAGYAVAEKELGQIDITNPKSKVKKAAVKKTTTPAPAVEQLKKDLCSDVDKFEEVLKTGEEIPTPVGKEM